MFFVPLSQEESVQLVIHSLKSAAGEADCTMCPAYRVCMKQCLTIAGSVEQMLQTGTLPQLGDGHEEEGGPDLDPDPPTSGPAPGNGSGRGRLKVVK